jgi:hypothetical protein
MPDPRKAFLTVNGHDEMKSLLRVSGQSYNGMRVRCGCSRFSWLLLRLYKIQVKQVRNPNRNKEGATQISTVGALASFDSLYANLVHLAAVFSD